MKQKMNLLCSQSGGGHVGQRAAQVGVGPERCRRDMASYRDGRGTASERLLRVRARSVATSTQMAAVCIATPQIRSQRSSIRLRQRRRRY